MLGCLSLEITVETCWLFVCLGCLSLEITVETCWVVCQWRLLLRHAGLFVIGDYCRDMLGCLSLEITVET